MTAASASRANGLDDVVIDVRGLRNQFGDFVVHEDLNLRVRKGEILGVVGGSGTGKSVLMRTIIGLKEPAAGTVEVFGRDFYKSNDAERLEIEKRWGVLFQGGALFSSMTVAQNVMTPIREHLRSPDALAQDIAALKISMSGLPPEAGDKYPSELSGGMKKRAGLARALALDPEIVFLDEPTAGLDPIGAAKFDELIVNLKKSLGLTVFMVTHDLDTLHAACDRIAVLAEKRVIECGAMDEVTRSDHPWIREYFSGPRGRTARAANTAAEAASGDEGRGATD
ncbi:MAG: ABC transporter ATP-binding protein [Pseudomonadota bacterium]